MYLTNNIPSRYRLAGILPLALFIARFAELYGKGETPHILWVCHISNLLIAIGLFLGNMELIRVSVLWLIIGAPLWPIDVIRTGVLDITSVGTHYVGLVIGLLAMRGRGMGKYSWLYALIWFLLLQQLARMFTPPELNVNIAHSIYPGWEQFFSAYWQYLIFITAGEAISLRLISVVLSRIFNAGIVIEYAT